MENKPLSVTVQAPWTDNQVKNYTGYLKFTYQLLDQLLFFQKANDTEHIRNDIKGYEEIINFESEDFARVFFKTKDDDRRSGNRKFKNNLEIVEYLKKDNLWETL